ncbi:hypothetical protein TorRG33x02_224670, partial [Trema orientale]
MEVFMEKQTSRENQTTSVAHSNGRSPYWGPFSESIRIEYLMPPLPYSYGLPTAYFLT